MALAGTVSVQYGAVSPTPSSLVSSADGQLAITPALGYAAKPLVDSSSSGVRLPSAGTKGGLEAAGIDNKGKGKGKQVAEELPWLKTAVTLDKKASIRWADWADEYDLNMPGMVENHWRAAAWSPSGLTHLGGCILAAITTNGEALLFGPSKNATTGEWTEIADLTSGLVRELAPDQTKQKVQTQPMRREMVAALLRCQATAVAWSGPAPGTASDRSLFALGHRSGEVSIWRLGGDDRKPECVARVAPADEVDIIHVLSWSEWRSVGQEGQEERASQTYTAQLAIADGDGRVFALTVAQDDGLGALRIAYSKLGTVHLATLEPDSDGTEEGWTLSSQEGVKEVELEMVGEDRWMGATPWALCSGVAYLPHQDSLLVSLSSSAFYHLSLSPHLRLSATPPEEADGSAATAALSPSALTSRARDVFEEVLGRSAGMKKDRFETTAAAVGGQIGRKEGAKIVGMVVLNQGGGAVGSENQRIGDVAFIFETARPDASIYRPYGQMKTYLVVADLTGPGLVESTAVDECMQVLAQPINARTACPLGKLLLPLHAIRRFSSSTPFVEGMLQYLTLPAVPGSMDDDAAMSPVEAGMREKLEAQIWADERLEQIREKETLARALLREDTLVEELRHEVQLAHTDLIRLLAKETLGRLASVLSSLKLTEAAKTVYARLLLASASTLPATTDDPQSATLPPEDLSQAFEQPDVLCPACRAPVPLANTRYACCESGHEWERCSVTLDLVSVVQARTCTACERKALLKSADPVLNELLLRATCCLFCGGRWMRVR
ncbi:hypothetical protein C6P46_003110 [Rhodotorula mucilaginosa]|uniref:Transcription factor IIIC 90kDa subunit N-terminal domain-containing protein n=1 Tax=Rhodotorula mucilaginosa TaxID=5537 RepID=A0A9P6W2F0_RHOMI|nr:hypothetical protein C6P46_003110 [Rhodotorula mucilaginosa]